MAIEFTPHLVTLTYEAALKSFWRKPALTKFLRECHISHNFLSSWSVDETKRQLLDRLFDLLQKNDTGKKVIYKMAKSLSEQTAFPDLRNWEDSDQKIKEAHKAVSDLKSYIKSLEEKVISEKEKLAAKAKSQAEKINIQRALTDKSKLQQSLDLLFPAVGTQKGGYDFEKWFYSLLDFNEIDNRKPYKVDGRQIDGSLTLEGTTYLVELKFTKNQSSAEDIDTIKAKINKMADNTMGVMVSISGYSSVAVNDASGSKTTLLLLDFQHLYLHLTTNANFKDIISRVRRHASQTGEAYLPVNKFGG